MGFLLRLAGHAVLFGLAAVLVVLGFSLGQPVGGALGLGSGGACDPSEPVVDIPGAWQGVDALLCAGRIPVPR